MESIIETKSFDFAVRIVRLNEYLVKEKREYVLAKQILRSGTSIGANVSEAHFAQSKADFIAKMTIALKETNETDYWLRVMWKTNIITTKQAQSLRNDCAQLRRILSAIVKTAKDK